MAFKTFTKHNYLYVLDTDNNDNVIAEGSSKKFEFRKKNGTANSYELYENGRIQRLKDVYVIGNILKEDNGIYSLEEFENFYTLKTGDSENVKYISTVLVDTQNIPANSDLYYYFEMGDSYDYFSLQNQTGGDSLTDDITLTLEATNQDDGTADNLCVYQPVTDNWFGTEASVNENSIFQRDTPVVARVVRLRVRTSDTGGNDQSLKSMLNRK